MDKIDVRVTAQQLSDVIDALAAAIEHVSDETQAGRMIKLGSWLTDRYTRRWGLPQRQAAELEAARGARQSYDQPLTGPEDEPRGVIRRIQ